MVRLPREYTSGEFGFRLPFLFLPAHPVLRQIQCRVLFAFSSAHDFLKDYVDIDGGLQSGGEVVRRVGKAGRLVSAVDLVQRGTGG
jgi:hypothetical protein